MYSGWWVERISRFFAVALLDDVGPSRLVPFLGAHAVAEQRIDIFLLHQRQRLVMAEIMPGPTDAHFADHIHRQGIVIHFDAAHIAVDGPSMSLSMSRLSRQKPSSEACMPAVSYRRLIPVIADSAAVTPFS